MEHIPRDERLGSLMGFLLMAMRLDLEPSREFIDVHRSPVERPGYTTGSIDEELIRQATEGGMLGCFRRFNAAVERNQHLRTIMFSDCCFQGLDLDHEGLKTLFSTVIPNHPTLHRFSLWGMIPPQIFKLLVEGITSAAADPLSMEASKPEFELELDRMDHPGVLEAAAHMVQNNAPVGSLSITFDWGTESWAKSICDALPTNRHLHSMQLRGYYGGGQLLPAIRSIWGRSSPLQRFLFEQPATEWQREEFLVMVRELRTNYTMEEIGCWPGHSVPNRELSMDRVHEVCELLSRHNYALRRIEGFDQHPLVAKLLRANAFVRVAHRALLEMDYRVARLAVWPLAMGRISSKPDLLYKFLRRGNCDALAQHLTPSQTRKQPHEPSLGEEHRGQRVCRSLS